jgi:hypothetical protein
MVLRPVHGTTSRPWFKRSLATLTPLLTTAPYPQTLVVGKAAVTTTGPKAGPIAPGDEILLMSGNYGNVWINIWAAEISNSALVTVAPVPGQTPVLTSLFVWTNDWVFNGLKVQSLQPAALSGNALVEIKDGGEFSNIQHCA